MFNNIDVYLLFSFKYSWRYFFSWKIAADPLLIYCRLTGDNLSGLAPLLA